MTAGSREGQTVLLTGAAGFIGHHVAQTLLEAGHRVIGVDDLNDYYDVQLKRDRLERLAGFDGFHFHTLNIADHEALKATPGAIDADVVIHLAAQAGVRHSIDRPFAYASSNLVGHLSVLELVRHATKAPRLVYASSSSVYGANTKTPFSENDRTDSPVSLYAATKRADELISESYSRLYGLSQIGLRFFTVYGPWGRPDMAYWSFTQNILEGQPIRVFNRGELMRDFTYIDDIVAGVIATALAPLPEGAPAHSIYNIGNNRPVQLMHFIELIEQAAGRKAKLSFEPMQPGDVVSTCADITAISRDFGYAPTTQLETGIPRFVDWYRAYTSR
ncbi:MAG: NAD-dependent epimerase/dehydratase family protein [Hyphomonadaceae bacterium]